MEYKMKIPYDRVLVQPMQYSESNFDSIPDIGEQDKSLVSMAAVMVANIAGAQATSNPARTYTYNVLCQNAWHNSDFDNIVGMVCASAKKKASLGAYVNPESAVLPAADEVLMLYTSSLCLSHDGVKNACPPHVKHIAAQNIGSWNQLKQEFPKMYANQYQIQITGYNQAGQPVDQFGAVVPPHLVPVNTGQMQPGVPAHYMQQQVPPGYMVQHPGQPQFVYDHYGQPQPMVNNQQPVFSGAPNPGTIIVGQQNNQVPPSRYVPRTNRQGTPPSQQMRHHQSPTHQQQQPMQQPTQNTQQPPAGSLATPTPDNRVLVSEPTSILEHLVDRNNHKLTPVYGGGNAEYGQILAAGKFIETLNTPQYINERRDMFLSNMIYATSVYEACYVATKYARAEQYLAGVENEIISNMRTISAYILTPIHMFLDPKLVIGDLANSKNFSEYLIKARELTKTCEAELKKDSNSFETFTSWQDYITITEVVDRLMTDLVNTYMNQNLHIRARIDSLLDDYEGLILLLQKSQTPSHATTLNLYIADVFNCIFASIDSDMGEIFNQMNDDEPGVDGIHTGTLSVYASITYVPILSRSLGAKLKPDFQKIIPENTPNLFKTVKELFMNVDSHQQAQDANIDKTQSGVRSAVVLRSYVTFDDGVILEVYRSNTRANSYYVRTIH